MFETAKIKFEEIGQNVKEKSLDFMAAHPKATGLVIGGAGSCTALMASGISASAEGESEAASGGGDLVDTVVSSMETQMNGALAKVLPAAIGIGITVFVVGFGYRLFKKFTH